MGRFNSEAAIQQGSYTVSLELRLVEMTLQMTLLEGLLVLTPSRGCPQCSHSNPPAGDALSVHPLPNLPAGDALSVHTHL